MLLLPSARSAQCLRKTVKLQFRFWLAEKLSSSQNHSVPYVSSPNVEDFRNEMLTLQQNLGEAHFDRAWCVSWNYKGTLLATTGGDKVIKIWAQEGDSNWVAKSTLSDAHSRTVRSAMFSPCGRLLASASFDSTVVVWEKTEEEFEVLSTLEGHENEVKCAAFSPSGRYLASCSRDKSVWVWEMDEDEDFQCCSILNHHSQDVKQILWHPKDDILVSVSYDNSVNFYKFDGDDWVLDQCLDEAHSSTVWSASFNENGSMLVTCSDDLSLKIWKKSDFDKEPKWQCCCTLSGYHKRSIYFVDWCPITGLIATACGDNCIRIFKQVLTPNNESTKEINFELIETLYDAHEQDVNCVRWNPTKSGLLASCSDDGFVKLWRFNFSD